MQPSALLEKISQHLGQQVAEHAVFRDELSLIVQPGQLVNVATALKNTPELGFELLVDVTAVDYQNKKPQRFEVIYHLYSVTLASYVRLKVPLADSQDAQRLPELPTLSHLWRSADWLERETYDMFGIHFSGHPNLLRILMTESMRGYPLRKDFPLHGYPEWPVQHERKRRPKRETGNAN